MLSNQRSNRNPWLLLGALVFCLSSVTGLNQTAEWLERDLASEQGCNLRGQLSGTNKSAECVAGDAEDKPNGVTARANIRLLENQRRFNARSESDTEDVLDIEIQATASCNSCMSNTTTSRRLTLSRSQFSSFEALENRIQQELRTEAQKARQKAAQERRLAQRKERCEIDEDGTALSGRKMMDCRIGRLQNMDPEKASEYFEEHIQEEIQALLNSNRPQDRTTAMALIAKLGRAMPEGNAHIKAAVTDLQKFAQYRQMQESAMLRISQLQGPQKQQALRAFQQNQTMANEYFRQRGIQVQNAGVSSGNPFFASLAEDLTEYQGELQSRYDAIAQNHRQLTAGPAAGAQPQYPSVGRTARGAPGGPLTAYQGQQQPMPRNAWPGGPGGMQPRPMPGPGPGFQGPRGPMPGPGAGMAPGGRPAYGAPVRR